jgi:hypothetical protein
MRLPAHALLLATALSVSGCAPYIATCGWVVPDAGPELKVVGPRKPTAGECNCLNCKAPGRFKIVRDAYTLELWNGDRWYPELYVRARGKDGGVLTLSADSPELLRMAPHVPASATHGFEYFMRFDSDNVEAPAKILRISVVDSSGQVLGVETVRLKVESRKDVSIEYI